MSKANRKKQSIFGITRPQAGSFLTDEELVAKQPKGTRFIKNEQTVLGGQYSGIMKSGKSVELSGDGVVKIPINATLGSELYNGNINDGNSAITATQIENGWHVVCDGTGGVNTNLEFSINAATPDVPLLVAFEANIISGSITYTRYYNGSEVVPLPGGPHTTTNGHNEFEIRSRTNTGTAGYYVDGSVPFEVEFTFPSTKEIQQVQGSVTTFNFDTKEFEQVGADGVGSKELVVNGDFNTNIDGWIPWNTEQTLSYDNNTLRITRISEGNGLNSAITTNPIPQRNRYRISLDYDTTHGGSNFSVRVGVYNDIDILPLNKNHVGSASKIVNVTANNVDGVYLRGAKANINDYWNVDNVSLKEALPLSTHYDLTDGTYGTICKLHTASFSQEDLALFNNSPEKLLQWSLGTITIPSGITFGADDRIYFPVEVSP